MSLQVRLRHSLGERLLELPDRPVDEPVVVGRASTADVQVPSVTVSSRHCVLFEHDGLWAVQEMPGTSGTFVNGAKVQGPTPLHVGDVITLGTEANAARIEIEPIAAAQGRVGEAAGGGAAGVMGSVAPVPVQAPAPVQTAQPVYSEPTHPVEYAPHAADTIAWPTDAGTGGGTRYYGYGRRRRQSGSGAAVGILLALLIAGGVGYFIYTHRPPPAQVARPAPAVPPAPRPAPPTTQAEPDTSQVPQSIFEKMNPRPRGKPSTGPTTTQKSPPQPGSSNLVSSDMSDTNVEPTDTDSTDPTGQDVADAAAPSTAPSATTAPADDPAWKQVQTARFSQDEAKAILKFDDFAQSHPGRSSAELEQYTEAAMDRIWFERIEQLCRQRDELTRQIQQTEKETAEETDEAYKKRVLVPLKQQYVNRLQSVQEALTKDMKYEATTAPNLLDDAQVEKLRRQRDPAYYAGWKTRVLTHIRRTHGELPWASM
jgi:hypothetical protein